MPELTNDGVTWSESDGNLTGRPNKIDDGSKSVTAAQARDHIDDTTNPHSVTAAQVSAIPESDRGVAGGVATLDSGVRIPVAQLPVGVADGLSYQGTWDAATNTPSLSSGSGSVAGEFYLVAVDGATTLDGISTWDVGDLVVFDGSAWQRVADNATDVVVPDGGTIGSATTPGAISIAANGDVNFAAGLLAGSSEVAEYGSNANGEYVRFYNGVQVCWGVGPTITSNTLVSAPIYKPSSSTQWDFPAAFSANPRVQINPYWVSGDPISFRATTPGDPLLNSRYFMYGMNGSEATPYLFAIGRWF